MPLPLEPIPKATDAAARQIVDAAFAVHEALGPGLLESAYEICLHHELRQRGVGVQAQRALPIHFRGVHLDAGLRLDLVVGERVIVELKSADRILPVHKAQVLSYLKLSGLRLGFPIDFSVPLIREGIRRIAL